MDATIHKTSGYRGVSRRTRASIDNDVDQLLEEWVAERTEAHNEKNKGSRKGLK